VIPRRPTCCLLSRSAFSRSRYRDHSGAQDPGELQRKDRTPPRTLRQDRIAAVTWRRARVSATTRDGHCCATAGSRLNRREAQGAATRDSSLNTAYSASIPRGWRKVGRSGSPRSRSAETSGGLEGADDRSPACRGPRRQSSDLARAVGKRHHREACRPSTAA